VSTSRLITLFLSGQHIGKCRAAPALPLSGIFTYTCCSWQGLVRRGYHSVSQGSNTFIA